MDNGEIARKASLEETVRCEVPRIEASDVSSSRGFQAACGAMEKSVSERAGRVLAYWTTVSRFSRGCTLDMLSHSVSGLPYMSLFYNLLVDDLSQAYLSLCLISEPEDDMSPSDVQYWLVNTFCSEKLAEDARVVVSRLTTLREVGTVRVPDYVLEAFTFLLERDVPVHVTNVKSNQHELIDESKPIDADLLDEILKSKVYTIFTSIYRNFCSKRLLESLNVGMAMSRFSKAFFLRTLTLDHIICLAYYYSLAKGDMSTLLLVLWLSKCFVPRFHVKDMAIWLSCEMMLVSEDLRSARSFYEEMTAKAALNVPKYFRQLTSLFSLLLDASRSLSTSVSMLERSSPQPPVSTDQSKPSTSGEASSKLSDGLAPAISQGTEEGRSMDEARVEINNFEKGKSEIKENRTDKELSSGELRTSPTCKPLASTSFEKSLPMPKSVRRLRDRKPHSKKTSSRNEDVNPLESTSTSMERPAATNLLPDVQIQSLKTAPSQNMDFQNGSSQAFNLNGSVAIEKVNVANTPDAVVGPRSELAAVSPRLQEINHSKFSFWEDSDGRSTPEENDLTIIQKISSATSSTTLNEPMPSHPRTSVPLPLGASSPFHPQPCTSSHQKLFFGEESDGCSSPEAEDMMVIQKVSSTVMSSCHKDEPLSSPLRSSAPAHFGESPHLPSQPSTSSTRRTASPREHRRRLDSIPKRHRCPVVALEKISLSSVEQFQISTKHRGDKLTILTSEDSKMVLKITTKTCSSTPESKPKKRTKEETQEPPRIPTPADFANGTSCSAKTKATTTSHKNVKKYGKKARKDGEENCQGFPRNADEAEKMLSLLMEDSEDSQNATKVKGRPSSRPSSLSAKPATPQAKQLKNTPSESPGRISHKSPAQTSESPPQSLPSTAAAGLETKKSKSKISPKKSNKASIEQICMALSASLIESKNCSSKRKKTPSENSENKPVKDKTKHSSHHSSKERSSSSDHKKTHSESSEYKEKSRDSRKHSSSSSRKSSKREDKKRSGSTEVQSTCIECVDKSEASISVPNKVDVSSLRTTTPNEKNSAEMPSNSPPSEVLGPKVMVEPVNGAPHPVSLESEIRERQGNSYSNAEEIVDNMDLVNVTEGSEVVIYESLPDHSTLQPAQVSTVLQQLPDSSTKEMVKTVEADSSMVHERAKFEVITVPHDSVSASSTSSFIVSNLSPDDSAGQAYPVVGQTGSWPPGYKAVMALQDPNEISQASQVECPVTFSADTADEVLQQIKEATVLPPNMGNPENADQTVKYVLVESQDDKDELLKNCLRAEKRKHIYLKEYKPEEDTYEILGITDNTQLELVQEVQETVLEEVEISIVTERLSEENVEGIQSGHQKQIPTVPSYPEPTSAKRPKFDDREQNFDGTNNGMPNSKRRPRALKAEGQTVSRETPPEPKHCALQYVDELLIEAAKEGNLRKIQHCLDIGANVNASNNYRRTALHYAVQSESLDATNFLIQKGAFVEAVDLNLSTPLHMAAKRGYSKILKTLLANGARLDAKERWGRTPLHFAASSGHSSIVTYLLFKGANPRQKDDDGWTCHKYAKDKGHSNILAVLESYNMNYLPDSSV